MNILIVDDEKLEIEIIQKMIEKDKIGITNIYTARNLKDAKNILEEYNISIMLCDIEMPGGSGLELTKWVREQKIELEIIYLTGYAKFNYAMAALKMGVVDYLLKPIEQNKLMEALEKAVKKLPNVPEETSLNAERIVNCAMEYIKNNCDKEITRSKLSEMFYIHQDYFSHIFKEKTGYSFIEYLIKIRMDKAKTILSRTDLPLTNVAVAVGYSNTAHFGKHFKRETGMTPREYRKKVRKNNE